MRAGLLGRDPQGLDPERPVHRLGASGGRRKLVGEDLRHGRDRRVPVLRALSEVPDRDEPADGRFRRDRLRARLGAGLRAVPVDDAGRDAIGRGMGRHPPRLPRAADVLGRRDQVGDDGRRHAHAELPRRPVRGSRQHGSVQGAIRLRSRRAGDLGPVLRHRRVLHRFGRGRLRHRRSLQDRRPAVLVFLQPRGELYQQPQHAGRDVLRSRDDGCPDQQPGLAARARGIQARARLQPAGGRSTTARATCARSMPAAPWR